MNGNEPAYPAYPGVYPHTAGLTKRELFAAMALQELLADPDTAGETRESFAKTSVKMADALLAELSKESAE